MYKVYIVPKEENVVTLTNKTASAAYETSEQAWSFIKQYVLDSNPALVNSVWCASSDRDLDMTTITTGLQNIKFIISPHVV